MDDEWIWIWGSTRYKAFYFYLYSSLSIDPFLRRLVLLFWGRSGPSILKFWKGCYVRVFMYKWNYFAWFWKSTLQRTCNHMVPTCSIHSWLYMRVLTSRGPTCDLCEPSVFDKYLRCFSTCFARQALSMINQ